MNTIALHCRGEVRVRLSEPKPAVEAGTKDPYAGVPRHVWQSLFVLISMIRPDWRLDEIADAIFGYRHKLAFPELSAAAIRAAQETRGRNTLALRIAMRDAAEQ